MEGNVEIDSTDDARNDDVLDSVRRNIKKVTDTANCGTMASC